MEFRMERLRLVRMLHTISSGVATRTPHLVLTGVLLQATETSLVATTYNLETGVRLTVWLEHHPDTTVSKPGSVVAPAKQLLDLVRKLTASHVTVSNGKSGFITLRSDDFECNLHGFDPDSFPELPSVSSGVRVSIPSSILKDMVASTAYAASTLDTRPVLTGICMELRGGKLRLSCTDSLRLATQTADVKSDVAAMCFIVPAKSMTELAHLLPDEDTPTVLTATDSHCLFTTGTTQLYTRIINGSYVDVSRLIPTLKTTVVVIRTQRLVQCLDRATVIAPKTQEIQFFVDDTQLVVFTESADYGKSTDVLVAESVAGDRAELRVNGRNVLQALRTCTSEEVVLQFTGKNRPLVLLPKNGTDLVHVISPIVSR